MLEVNLAEYVKCFGFNLRGCLSTEGTLSSLLYTYDV